MRELENRQIEILQILNNANDYLPVHIIAEKLEVSTKTVYRDIEKIIENREDIKLLRKQGKGIKVQLPVFFLDTSTKKSLSKYSIAERRVKILYNLLRNSKKYTSIKELSELYYVSKSSIVNDLNYLEARLLNENIKIEKNRLGIRIIGDEKSIRKKIMCLVREYSFISDENKEEYYSDRIEKETLKELTTKFDVKKIEIVEKIITRHERNLPYTIGDLYYINLVVHLLIAIERINSENYLDDNDIPKISDKEFYREAENIAIEIEKEFSITLPLNEVYYIYQYLVSTGVGNLNNDILLEVNEEVEEIIEKFLHTISDKKGVIFSGNDNVYYLFKLHIRALLRRLKYGIIIKNPLLKKIKGEYQEQFNNIQIIAREILSKDINDDEIAYLTLYTESILNLISVKTKVILVCNSGFGTSLFLKKRIEDKIENIEVVDVVSAKELKRYDLSKINFIFSTVKLENVENVIYVNVMLNEEDIKNINRKVYRNDNEI